MTDERPTMSRRDFTALTVATGFSVAARADAPEVSDTDVLVKTPSGTCDAAFVHPQGKGRWPAVILFTDAFGLRPSMREMAKRLAADGYAVLVPNPFYRSTKAPGIGPGFDFGNPIDRAKLDALRAPLTSDAIRQDVIAYVTFLDAQASVDKKVKMGVVGYCMGGPMTIQAAAASPERVGAAAAFHPGGGMVTGKPDSPHLLMPSVKAQFYVGIAGSDDKQQPDMKTKLDDVFRAANVTAKIEVYEGTLHGWCIKDMPLQAEKPIYAPAQAEKAWDQLLTLYKQVI